MVKEIVNQMHKNYLFAVVRGESPQDAYDIAYAAYKGGVKNLEITFTTPRAEETIEQLLKDLAGTDAVVGAGTVVDVQTAKVAIDAGSQFIVGPNFSSDIAAYCVEKNVPYLPGCATVTEICNAMAAGASVIKLFPGGLLGPGFIKDVHAPLPHVEMMPSGSVSVDNVDKWIAAKAWGVGVGSALTKNLCRPDYTSVTNIALEFSNKVNELLK